MKYIKNFFLHTKKILTHKWWVFYYCCLCGIPWRGFWHDTSKFSPVEFWEGVKYYQGNRSPIDACKEDKGYSKAWLHHKAHNKHHPYYWSDNFDNGASPILMPDKYILELFCDYLGAGRAYQGKNFTYKSEFDWWSNKIQNPIFMHPAIKIGLDRAFFYLDIIEETNLFKDTIDIRFAKDIMLDFIHKEII